MQSRRECGLVWPTAPQGSEAKLAGSSRPLLALLGSDVWAGCFQKAGAVLRDVDLVAIGTQLLPRLWIRAEGRGTALREHGPDLEAADALESFDLHSGFRSLKDLTASLKENVLFRTLQSTGLGLALCCQNATSGDWQQNMAVSGVFLGK